MKETHIVFAPHPYASKFEALKAAKKMAGRTQLPVQFEFKDSVSHDFFVIHPKLDITKNGAKLGG